MGFKADIESHLLDMIDVDAFGETITVDGAAVVAIFSPPEKEPVPFEGIYLERRMLYCRTRDIIAPVTGQQLTINGDRWTVDTVETWDGFFGAELMRNMS